MSECGKDYTDAATEKDDDYYDAQEALLKAMVGGECSTAEAFYQANADGFGVNLGVKGGVAVSTGCESIATTFNRTINQMVNASCTQVETTMNSQNIVQGDQKAEIDIYVFAAGNVNISDVKVSQSTDFELYSQNQFTTEQTETLLQELTTEIATDLANAIESTTDFPADVNTGDISVQINNVQNQTFNIDQNTIDTTMNSLNELKFISDAKIKLAVFAGENANISNIVITQDMVGRAELLNIFGTAATSIVEQMGATGIVTTLKNTVTSTTKTTNINWTYVIPMIVFGVVVIAGLISWSLIKRGRQKKRMMAQMSKQNAQMSKRNAGAAGYYQPIQQAVQPLLQPQDYQSQEYQPQDIRPAPDPSSRTQLQDSLLPPKQDNWYLTKTTQFLQGLGALADILKNISGT